MNNKGNQWCAVSGCMSSSVEKRHFFRFPKENNRWLQWIRASNRLDLEPKGPNYAYNNCRLCHLHFEEKWLIRKTKLRLDPEAVPTLFLDPISENSRKMAELAVTKQMATEIDKKQGDTDMQRSQRETNIIEPGTSRNIRADIKHTVPIKAENLQEENRKRIRPAQKSEDSPRRKKLKLNILNLRRKNKRLQESVRRLKKKLEQQKMTAAVQERDVRNISKLSRK